jgi:hypothetical protein
MRNNRIEPHRPDDGSDRRAGRRYPALDNTSQVRWSYDDQVFTTAAQLMDVSREGLLVLVDEEPASGVSVLVRLVEPVQTSWVEANVQESRPMKQGPYQLRLVFTQSPPAGFLALATARDSERN